MLEDEAGRGRGTKLVLMASREAALYVLNKKRAELAEIEARYGVLIEVASDNEEEGARMTVEVSGPPPAFAPRIDPPVYEEDDEEPLEDFAEDEDEQQSETEQRGGEHEPRDDGEGGRGRRRRRRGRRARPDEERPVEVPHAGTVDTDTDADEGEPEGDAQVASDRPSEAGSDTGDRKRRGRRGGRRRRGRGNADRELRTDSTEGEVIDVSDDGPAEIESVDEAQAAVKTAADPVKPKRTRKAKAPELEAAPKVMLGSNADQIVEDAPEKPKRTRRKKVETEPVAEPAAELAAELAADDDAAVKPKRTRKPKVDKAVAAPVFRTVPVAVAEPDAADDMSDDAAKRGGWWQRTFGATN